MKNKPLSRLRFFLFFLVMNCLPFHASGDGATVAVDHVTGWPNLTTLPDGSFLLAGFDKPSHGQVEGDVASWISEDQGETWTWQGKLTEHEPQTVRMNHAVGLTRDGDLIALVSGWSDVQQPDSIKRNVLRDKILRPWICRSTDQGKTWTVIRNAFPTDPIGRELIPFGDIVLADDGSLRASLYSTSYWDRPGPWAAYFVSSEDDGRSWRIRSEIGSGINETALLSLGNGEWLAAARATSTLLFRSEDDGKTWENLGPVTERRQFPAHLLRLKDGRVVLTYGDRREGHFGIGARISDDGGKTWSEPSPLASMQSWDGGYPASLETSDGRIMTVFYSKKGDLADYALYRVFWDGLTRVSLNQGTE
jgi:hypothetical protein